MIMGVRPGMPNDLGRHLWSLGDAVREVVSPTACVGCLDTRRCWVCLGHGTTEIEHRAQGRPDEPVPCTACHGTGVCEHCRARWSG